MADKNVTLKDAETGDNIYPVTSASNVIMDNSSTVEQSLSGLNSSKVDKTTTIAGIDLQDNITKSELLTALNVADGAEANTIESISAGGTALTPDANRDVALPISYGENHLGLVQTSWNYYSGLVIGNDGTMIISSASDIDISNRYSNKPIVPTKLNTSVKATLTDENHITMTSAEQDTAQIILGVNILSGSSAPTTSTVGRVGQLYIDTTNNITYQCVAITTESDVTTYTWKELANVPLYREVSNANIFPPSNVAFEYPGQMCIVQDVRYGRYHTFICTKLTNGSYTWSLLTPNAGTGTDSLALGQDSTATGYDDVALGPNTHATGGYGIAIGNGATTSASQAIQIGNGTNSTANTLNVGFQYVGNYQLLNSSGKIPQERFSDCLTGSSAPTTSTVASYIGQLYKDTTNNKLYICDGITEDTSTTPSTFTYTWTQLIRITDKANNDNFGVVRLAQGRGLDLLSDGRLFVDVAGDVQITNRTIGRPLSTERINFAVLSALTDARHLTMTSAQQVTAQEVLGITPRGIARL